MKKILYLSNSSIKNSRYKGLSSFNYTSYRAILALGIEYHGNTFSQEAVGYYENEQVHLHLVQIYRDPFSWDVIIAYRQLIKLLREEQFDIIHCNTPIGGFLGRVCGKIAKVPKIIYQAHGLHFYKGAPLFNWLLYYPIEKWLAHYSDAIITINNEDYELAKSKFQLRNNGKVYYVPGVGVDLDQFIPINNRKELRESLGIEKDELMLISAGDLIERKNYKTSIEAISKTGLKNIKYCICGQGPQLEELKQYAKKLDVENNVLFLGFRKDVKDLLQAADIFLFTTKQEGLPRSMMEAMACGIPCIASKIRGNVDLLEDGTGGFLCDVNRPEDFACAITTLASDAEMRKNFGKASLKRIQEFSQDSIIKKMEAIYREELMSI